MPKSGCKLPYRMCARNHLCRSSMLDLQREAIHRNLPRMRPLAGHVEWEAWSTKLLIKSAIHMTNMSGHKDPLFPTKKHDSSSPPCVLWSAISSAAYSMSNWMLSGSMHDMTKSQVLLATFRRIGVSMQGRSAPTSHSHCSFEHRTLPLHCALLRKNDKSTSHVHHGCATALC